MSKYTIKCNGYGEDRFLKNVNDNTNPLMTNYNWINDINDCDGISFDDAVKLKVKFNENIVAMKNDKFTPWMDKVECKLKGVYFTVHKLEK